MDCTAAPVLNVLAVMLGSQALDEKWMTPIGDTILTTMRRMQKLGIEELIELTCDCVRRAVKNG